MREKGHPSMWGVVSVPGQRGKEMGHTQQAIL